jgi:DNA repair exonuclease SbcCD ATPase subunit
MQKNNSMIFKTLNGDLTVFNRTLISTKDHLKSLQTVNATVHNKNGVFNLQGLLVNSSQSVSTFTKLNNAFKAYNGNLSKSTQLQNAYVQAVGKQNVTLGNYLAGLNGAKASMGGYVKSLVAAKAASIGLQAASIALNTAISMGITLAISALISAITKWVNKEKEAREEAIENAKAAKEEANNLSELLNKYNQLSKEVTSNQGVKEDLLSVQSDLLEALGIEASQIDTLIEKYGDLNSAINQITLDSLRDAQGDLMVAIDAYEKDLIKVGKGYAHWYSLFDRNLLSTGQSSTDALDILEKAGIISSGSHGEGGGALVLTGNDKTVEGILENYQKLKDAQEALNTAIDNGEITMEEMIKIPLYNDINSRLEELEESIGNYNTAIADLNKNMAQQQILKSLAEQSSIPETKEEFEAFQQSMIDTAIASTKFKGSQDDIRDSIINVLSVMPEFKKYFEELNDIQGSTLNKNPISLSLTDTIDQLNTQLKPTFDSLKSAYENIFTTDDNGKPLFTLENVDLSMLDSIKSAIDELNENEELGISIDYTSFENLARTLADTASTEADVRNGFNEFITDIVYGTAALENLNASDAKLIETMLESLGVTNAHEIVYDSLIAKTEALALQEQLLSSVGGDLTNVTSDKVLAFLNQAGASETARNYLIKLIAEEQVFSNQELDVSGKISKLQELAQAYGQTALAAKIASQEKANEQSHTVGSWSEADLQQFQKEWNDGLSSVSIDFSPKSSSKSKKSGSSKSEKDLWLEEYKRKLAELQNLLAKGIINEREFFSQSEILLNTYLKDSEEHMTKYAEEISDAEKTLHSDRVNAYQYEADELSRLQGGNYINMAEYYQSMMGLQDEYYNSEALKLKNLADTMEAQYGRMSHVTLTRPSVDAAEIQSAGYTTELPSSSVYAQSFGDETKQVVLTPILPDGTILSPEALQSYAVKLLNGEKIDADIQLSMFEGKDAVKQTVEYINGLEKMQSEYQTLKKTFSESPYGDFTEEQLEALEKLTEEIEKHKSQLSSELGGIKSAYDDLIEIRDTYNEYGKISVDQYQSLCGMGFEYLALLSNESGALSLDEDAFQRLTDAKIQQIQVDMALQATDLIKNIQTEEQAVQYLAASYENLAANALSAAEQMLYAAQANAQLMYGADSMQAQAANTIVKGYENSKLAAGVVDIKMQSGGGYPEEKKKKEENSEERDWAEKILDNIEKNLEKSSKFIEKISDQTGRLIDKVERFFSWQKKNAMINRAVKSTDKEINANQKQISQLITAVKKVKGVSDLYAKKMDKIGEGLSGDYKNKIKNGTLQIEDIEDTDLQETIKNYEKWYGKLQDCKETMDEYNDSVQECRDAISSLYEQQRDLIRQKLDNILSYYSDMDSYLSSITSKIESIISLNDEMGKRSSISELVEEFAAISEQLNPTVKTELTGSSVTENSFGDSKKVAEAVKRDQRELVDSIQKEIDNLSVDQSGTYTKLLKNIAKTEAQIDKYISKGWNVTRSKQFDKLTQKLQNYYDLQNELDQNATSNTITNYSRIYTAYQKLQNKLDSGKTLSKSEQKRFASYEKQLEVLRNSGQNALDRLSQKLAEADGTAKKQTEAEKIKDEISNVQEQLENSATYRNLLGSIEKVKRQLAVLDDKGYDNLTKSQKKKYDRLQSQLEAYYSQKEALDENATAANIAEYNKIYLAWKKLQDKLDKGKNLSVNEWKKYNTYTDQLENYSKEKADALEQLNEDLADALDPGDKLEQIEKTYEESAEGIYESYNSQIDSINDEAESTQQYQNLLAKAQKLEQKKDTKGLSKSEQAQLDKYNAELEAIQKGAMGTNISEYMKTWESWYKLQQKLDNGGKLSANEAKKYDTYKAQLEAWNNEKQTQISDLLSQMEDDLEQLKKTYEENVSDAEADINEYHANLYKLAKQIAEYNLTTLKAQLEYLDSFIGYYKELVSLYDTFSGDKLTKLLTDLDENTVKTKVETYGAYLDVLQEKYDTTLSEMNEYGQLLDALDTNDFEASMDVFNKALESYRQNGDTAMADKLQSVLDLLNERAVDADNWGEFADQWAEEWEKEFASAKQELIGTATEIQNVNDALRNAKFENITNAISELDTAKSILSSITDLIQDEWLYDNGELSEYGQAKVALLVSQLEDAHKKADAYLDLYNEIQNNKDTYASDKAYMEDLNNAIQNYYNTLGESASLENSIIELMKRSAQEELDSLNKIIDARKKALQKKKEYYDYNKTIKNSQKEIDSIKAQIAAIENLSGAMDAATKAKLAQLKADLAEKEDALKETKDEHTYTLQIDALDEFAASLEEALDNSTKSLAEIFEEHNKLMGDAKDLYQTVGGSVNSTLDKIKDLYSGTGTITGSTDIDLTPKGNETSRTGSTPSINITPTVISNESTSRIKDDPEDVSLIIKQNMLKAAELFEKYGSELMNPERVFKVNDQNMFEMVNRQFSVMASTGQNIPDYVRNKNEQSVVNIHYDNMINVEGSVDKSFSREFKKDSEEIYNGVVNRLTKDLKHHGVNFIRRPTLPTVR